MDFTVWEDVGIGSLYAVFVSVFMLWFCRRFGAKQNVAKAVEPLHSGDITSDETLGPRQKVFLSHSGAQKNFVEQLCVDLERCDRYPFFDKRRSSLPLGRNFPKLIFGAIEQCEVGVVVISEEFFTLSKWPMLELVAMTRNAKLVIIPVFLGMSLEQYRDPNRQKRWVSVWRGWARQEKTHDRKIDIEEWRGALKALGPLNGLIHDGGSEVSLREKIVKAVCDVVLPETRRKDSHVHGRFRLVEVVCRKIDEAQVSKKYGVPLVGLYGVGGIGKTTICRSLCNEYFTKMQGRVFHAELGGARDVELLHGALKSLTNKSHEYICGLEKSQCEDLLEQEMQKQAIFLALDNLSDIVSLEQAKYFLTAGFNKGSIVVVAARSLEALKLCHLNIDDGNCLHMPELLEDEAKSLFMEHALYGHEVGLEINNEIIANCLKRCYFQKGDGKSYHYHPLALKVLGTQLGCWKYDQNKWAIALKEMVSFNRLREKEDPIFSILRKSFDTLELQDQMLFMDVVLFLPRQHMIEMDMTWFDWLSMVHDTSVLDIMERLEGLKRKSLLEDLGDGQLTKIGMHDLWREFGVMESKAGVFEGRRWIYGDGGPNTLEEGTPSGGCWQNMKRMCFLKEGLRSVERVNLDHFPNIIVMKLVNDYYLRPVDLRPVDLVLDVQKLNHLKSLQSINVEVTGLGLLKNLWFLDLHNSALSEADVDGIGHLTNLRVLLLKRTRGKRLPNVSKLILLEEVHFFNCRVATISGFSSRLSKLRILDLNGNYALRRLGLGVGHLIALQVLCLRTCRELEELPSLQKLTNLRILDISGCPQIKSLSGLGELVVLQQLWARYCKGLAKVPDMCKLTNLQVLDLRDCSLESMPSMENLIPLQQLHVGFGQLPQQPKLSRHSVLQDLHITRYNSQEVFVSSLASLSKLEYLNLHWCTLVDELPDCQGFNRLKVVEIYKCGFKDVWGLSNCAALKTLEISSCHQLERLPNLHKLFMLKSLYLKECDMLGGVHCFGILSQMESVTCLDLPMLTNFPDLRCFPQMRDFKLHGCAQLVQLECTGPLVALDTLFLANCRNLISVPDMSRFPHVLRVRVWDCDNLMALTYIMPLYAVPKLYLDDCGGLKANRDLSNFQGLKSLELMNCNSLTEVMCTGALTALETISLLGCRGLKAIPHLSNFQGLKSLEVTDCTSLTEVMCTGTLTALEKIELQGCLGLKATPELSNFQGLKSLWLVNCESLTEVMCTKALTALETIRLRGCALKTIPDLSNFQGLKSLEFMNCKSLTEVMCTEALTALETIELRGCRGLKAIPDLSNFQSLTSLWLMNCESLTEVMCTGALTRLEKIELRGCRGLKVIPDLSNFQGLKVLRVIGGESIMELTCTREPLVALEELNLDGCRSLNQLPNLNSFLRLKALRLGGSQSLVKLTCLSPLPFLEELDLGGCSSLNIIPKLMSDFSHLKVLRLSAWRNLQELLVIGSLTSLLEELDLSGCKSSIVTLNLSKFSQLKLLRLNGWENLEDLFCMGPLAKLKELDLGGCKKLSKMPDLRNFLKLEFLQLKGCESLAELTCGGRKLACFQDLWCGS